MSISTRQKYNRWKLDKKLKEWGQYERYIDHKGLNLANNNIEEIPSWIGGLKKIEILDLSNNNTEEIPNWIGELKELKTLDLENNNIEEIPTETLKKCNSLKFLWLHGNPIPQKELERAKKELIIDII